MSYYLITLRKGSIPIFPFKASDDHLKLTLFNYGPTGIFAQIAHNPIFELADRKGGLIIVAQARFIYRSVFNQFPTVSGRPIVAEIGNVAPIFVKIGSVKKGARLQADPSSLSPY